LPDRRLRLLVLQHRHYGSQLLLGARDVAGIRCAGDLAGIYLQNGLDEILDDFWLVSHSCSASINPTIHMLQDSSADAYAALVHTADHAHRLKS